MNQERFWELVSLKLSGEAQASELDELALYLQEYPDEGIRVEMMTNVWNAKRQGEKYKKEAFNKHMQRLSNHLSDPVLQYEISMPQDEPTFETKPGRLVSIKNLARLMGIAATLFIAIVIFGKLTEKNPQNKVSAQNTVSTKRGSKSKVVLPDGSQVWLNADSRITYNEQFQGSLREVALSGEAFFDVVRDESRPFIIHTPTIDVKVLGTAFNVKSYAEEKNTETSLIRGSVEITLLKSPDLKKIILKPNEKLIVPNNGSQPSNTDIISKSGVPVVTIGKVNFQKKDNSAIETLWTKNKLAFDEEKLEEIALKIERWYDVNVIITDDNLKKETYTATFPDYTLVEVMEALKKGGGFNYAIDKKQVTISAHK